MSSIQPNKPSTQQQPVFRRSEISLKITCPTCRIHPPDLEENFSAGDLVCRRCGTIVGDRIIDERSEWRTFASESGGVGDDPSRVGGPANPLLDGDGLETLISGSSSSNLGRLQNKVNYKPAEKNLMTNFKVIGIFCDRIGLPRVIADRAKQLFKKADEAKLTKGSRMIDGLVAACIYVACKQEQAGRTFKDISSLTQIPIKDIGRCYKIILPLLEDRQESLQPKDLIARFCSFLNLKGTEVPRLAAFIVERISELGIATGRAPTSIASACIFMACQLLGNIKSYREIAQVAGISDNTVKLNYKDLYLIRHQLLPETIPPERLLRIENPTI